MFPQLPDGNAMAAPYLLTRLFVQLQGEISLICYDFNFTDGCWQLPTALLTPRHFQAV